MRKIAQSFVAFSEKLNFMYYILAIRSIWLVTLLTSADYPYGQINTLDRKTISVN